MRRLIGVELRRMGSRRILWGFVIGVATMMALVSGYLFFQSESLTSNQVAFERAERERTACEANVRNGWEDGTDPPFPGETISERLINYCGWIQASNFTEDKRFCLVQLVEHNDERGGCDLVDAIAAGRERERWQGGDIDEGYQGILPFVALPLLLLSLVIPASFIGSEYRSGTMENLLLWEPRRMVVLGAKLIAGAISAFAVQVGLLALLVVFLAPVAIFRGSTVGADAEFWLLVSNIALRSGVVAAMIALAAMSIAIIARHSAGALVALVGYGIVASAFFGALVRGQLHREVVVNAQAFVRIGEVPRRMLVVHERGWTDEVWLPSHGSLMAGVHVLVWLSLVMAVATWSFRTRDID